MKIYFAGSIRGGGSDASFYKEIIEHLRKHGEVVGGEHADEVVLSALENEKADDQFIYNRDSKRLDIADVLIAEVTAPSLGVGYEIGVSVGQGKKILCLFRKSFPEKKLSAMINGSPNTVKSTYSSIDDVKKAVDDFFSKMN
ncbi:nucleoside 2-deoxyribosyltransferase [Patescibacteria group bacterium]